MASGVLFDIDGTLVDTNYQHVVAWSDAFRAAGYSVDMSTIHGLIGQGSERLVESVLGEPDKEVVDGHTDFYGPSLYNLRAFDAAGDLLRRCKAAGLTVVLATSASSRDAEHLRDAIGADDVVDHTTTNDDADASKPAPDIVEAALEGAGLEAADCIFVGDTVWDVQAANRAGMDCICVLTGGIAEAALRDAGAVAIYAGVADLLAGFDESLLAQVAAS
jgi:phosphoglycolate phosphatase-like HAD superfamily hydrolase